MRSKIMSVSFLVILSLLICVSTALATSQLSTRLVDFRAETEGRTYGAEETIIVRHEADAIFRVKLECQTLDGNGEYVWSTDRYRHVYFCFYNEDGKPVYQESDHGDFAGFSQVRINLRLYSNKIATPGKYFLYMRYAGDNTGLFRREPCEFPHPVTVIFE